MNKMECKNNAEIVIVAPSAKKGSNEEELLLVEG